VIEHRQSVRHDVDLACSLTVGGVEHHTQIKNLSVGGAQIVHVRLPAAERVKLKFRVPTLESAIEVSGTVRWSGDGAIGVQFDGLRAREVWSLNKYLESLSAA
jgi:PilZ domain-containing protein